MGVFIRVITWYKAPQKLLPNDIECTDIVEDVGGDDVKFNVISGNNGTNEVPFTKVLSGFTDTILQSEHNLLYLRGLRVCDPGGEEVEVKETYPDATSVKIDSNVLLDDHVLTMY